MLNFIIALCALYLWYYTIKTDIFTSDNIQYMIPSCSFMAKINAIDTYSPRSSYFILFQSVSLVKLLFKI